MGKEDEEINTEKENANKTEENLSRMVVTKEADRVAMEVLESVNEGFDAGRATKLDVVSFIFRWFKSNLTDDVIHQIRMSCTDEVTMLENVLKKARSSGNLPPEITAALAQHFFGGVSQVAKKSKKSLKDISIIDTNKESEAA